jgi:3-dehydroquinate synthase
MDEELFHTLDQKKGRKFNTAELKDIVMRCSSLKAGIVEIDETERSGQRAILNFGHTVGHALEAATKLRTLSHGEAVAIGMMAAARISEQMGILEQSDVNKIESLLLKFGLPTYCQGVNPDDLFEATRFDKKTTLGQTNWVLLQGIGKGIINQPVAGDVVRRVLREVCQ